MGSERNLTDFVSNRLERKMNCDKAITKITNYILDSYVDKEPAKETIREAMDHIAACPHCLEELDAMSSFFTGERSSLIEQLWGSSYCGECEAGIAEYVEDELDGVNVEKEHFLLWLHLQVCPTCRKDYADLKTMVGQERTEEVWTALKNGIRCLKENFQVSVGQGLLEFKDLFSPLIPKSVVTNLVPTMGRQGAETVFTQGKMTIPVPHLDLELKLTWEVAPEQIRLHVEARERTTKNVPSGIHVTLTHEGGSTGGSLEGGKRMFSDLKVGREYRLEIEYKDETLEIPLPIVEKKA